MGHMNFLQEASKSDLIDIIISLQSQLGEEVTEERFAKCNKWPLIKIFITLEDRVNCGHTSKALDINECINDPRVWKLKEFFRRGQKKTEGYSEYLGSVKKLAVEAGLDECGALLDRYVVGRVLAGISDSSVRDREVIQSKFFWLDSQLEKRIEIPF